MLKLRVFDYFASDPLIEMRPPALCPHAMRPHLDGSIGTLVIAPSDGLLRLFHRRQWHAVQRTDGKPFALFMPGIAALHDLGIAPTPHLVLPTIEHRVSVTVFQTPDLGSTDIKQAQARLRSWNMWRPRRNPLDPPK